MVLKLELFKELEKGEVQGFRDQIEVGPWWRHNELIIN